MGSTWREQQAEDAALVAEAREIIGRALDAEGFDHEHPVGEQGWSRVCDYALPPLGLIERLRERRAPG
jgi:hypothetical protein